MNGSVRLQFLCNTQYVALKGKTIHERDQIQIRHNANGRESWSEIGESHIWLVCTNIQSIWTCGRKRCTQRSRTGILSVLALAIQYVESDALHQFNLTLVWGRLKEQLEIIHWNSWRCTFPPGQCKLSCACAPRNKWSDNGLFIICVFTCGLTRLS